jgi:hypothetical protein
VIRLLCACEGQKALEERNDLGPGPRAQVADAKLVRAAGRYREGAGVGLAHLLPSEAPGHVGSTASLEATISLIRDRTKPEPALQFDARCWVGRPAILVYEGPEVIPDVGLGGVVFHRNIMQQVDHLHPSGRLRLSTLMPGVRKDALFKTGTRRSCKPATLPV